MRGIYEDISYNKDRKLPKLKLFFNLPDHACDAMANHPMSVVDEYLKMHLKDGFTYDMIFELIKMDYQSTSCDGGGLSTNVIEYLGYYMDIDKLGRPKHHGRYNGDYQKKEFDFTPLVKETIDSIFNNRDLKILLLTEEAE